MFIQFIVNAHNVRKTTKMVNFDHIFDVFSVQYNWIVLIHFASCQTSPGTSLEYPHHIHLSIFENWLFGAIIGLFWPFLSLYEPFGAKLPLVGTLNLCQKMPDKILKDSCQYVHSVHSKRPKCQKNNENGQFWPHFWRFLSSIWLNCPDSFFILSDISWDKFRVPTPYA